MASNDPSDTASSNAPFVLRPLLEGVPLSEDGSKDDIKINCVEYFESNLYIGTSASELLHFFQIPPDPADRSGRPVFILASRLQPAYPETAAPRPGVQQILLLPTVGKACILCNSTATFYSLPELTPVFGTQVRNCHWIGAPDPNETASNNGGGSRGASATILLSLTRKIQVVRIGDDQPRVIKKIDFAESTLSVRRDRIACVADRSSYALLDVDRQLKIPLMTISSLDESQPSSVLGQAQKLAGEASGGLLRSSSSAQSRPLLSAPEQQGHNRSTSLGGFMTGRKQDHRAELEDPVFRQPTPPTKTPSPRPPGEASDKPLPAAPGATSGTATPQEGQPPRPGPVFLRPHILSPTPEEFLLVTGTGPLDPGIGMFVNLDGDPTRPTLEFERYPREIAIDGGSSDLSSSRPSLGDDEEGYVLASMAKESGDGLRYGLEVQRFDSSGATGEKFWLEAPDAATDEKASGKPSRLPLGVRSLLGSETSSFPDLVDKLSQKKFVPFAGSGLEASAFSLRSLDSRTALSMERQSQERELFERDLDSQEEEALPEGWETKRNSDEEEFAARLAKTTSRLAVWAGNNIWWAVRNPLLPQLESDLLHEAGRDEHWTPNAHERIQIFAALNSFRGRDARNALEFMTFNYLRQQGGLLLLTGFLNSKKAPFTDAEIKALEEILVDGGLDPRVVLALVPGLRTEIMVSRKGIWIFGGVKKTAERYLRSSAFEKSGQATSDLDPIVLQSMRRFLNAWRRKKGFGSVVDESEVFRTVDAALLVVLLELDKTSPQGLAKSGTLRAELYELVDKGVDCFDRAVTLLEAYHRLFVLSRLYQSRKMSADVLATWRRIVEGEPDEGGEFRDGEQRVREYLVKISSQALVQEYGLWLATRNPKLGVQVFADDKGRAPKFDPPEVVAMLKAEAPDAVRYYLEHLVFGKGHTEYVNDLIAYYLDIVISDLQTSQTSRDTMAATYDAYRALQAPKPTYRQFLTENAPEDDELWHSRLRLLQLLGGAHDYDAGTIREQIAALPGDLLVPETIILDGRERHHEDALRLLVHKLGDYDTAVSYCLRGGPTIYTPPTHDGRSRADSLPTRDQQERLFAALLREFLALADLSDRVEQTGALLDRFGGWFDVEDVLRLIPDSWSVDIVAGFLISALRRIVEERHTSMVARALSSAENLRINADLLARIDQKGPAIETPD